MMKDLIPTCNIMGVNIAAINMEWLIDFTKKHIKELSGDYMCVSNVHTTVMSYDDPGYCAVQNGGIMAIPDGGPLSSVGRKRGFSQMRRTTGPDYMKEILKIEDRSKVTDCTFRIPELNIDSNRNLVILMYNEIQRTKSRLQEARQSVRLLEELLQQKEKEFRMLEPLVELEFNTTEKEWESQEVNTVINNSTDYRNTNI